MGATMKYVTKNLDRNRRIVDQLRAGVKPNDIAAAEGMTAKAIYRVKFFANKDGAGLPNKLPLRGDDNISVWARAIEDEQRYQACDEEWDDDEPYGPIQRCRCGLTMPCFSCLDLANYTRPVSSAVWDNFPIVPVGHSASLLLQGKTAKGTNLAGEV